MVALALELSESSAGCRVEGVGFRVEGLGLRVSFGFGRPKEYKGDIKEILS